MKLKLNLKKKPLKTKFKANNNKDKSKSISWNSKKKNTLLKSNWKIKKMKVVIYYRQKIK